MPPFIQAFNLQISKPGKLAHDAKLTFLEILPPSQGIRHHHLRVFYLTKIYSKYIKNVGINLASLKSMFQYKSNDTNFSGETAKKRLNMWFRVLITSSTFISSVFQIAELIQKPRCYYLAAAP
jgi:hypothetical protein